MLAKLICLFQAVAACVEERSGYVMEVCEHEIYQFLQKNEGKATIKDLCNAFGDNKESERAIRDKLLMMARFKMVTIEGKYVALMKRGD